jgi:glutamate-1-semialdehyde 2,1-aminomutase
MFVSAGVVHGGTYNAHPMCMAAAVATLRELRTGAAYRTLEEHGHRLMTGISDILHRYGLPARVQGFPGIFHVAFGIDSPIETYRDSWGADRARYIEFTTAALARGVRALERGAWFMSSTHDAEVLERTLETLDTVVAGLVVEHDD